MHHRSHRYHDYCERDCECDSSHAIAYRERPIYWPERPSPSFTNLPSIPILWPMPMMIQMSPLFGSSGATRPNYDEPYYSDRRGYMNRNCCEEPREYKRCCERCGYYD